MAQRQLLLGRLTVLNIVGSLVSIFVTILSASLGLGVWSFVLGLLISQVFNTVGTHVFLPGIRNSWQWDRTVFREIFGFGKWLVPASMAGFFLNQGDKFFFSAWMDAETYSVYIIAVTWAMAATILVRRAMNSVGFSALSEVLREGREAATKFYHRIRLYIDVIAVVLFIGFNGAMALIVRYLYPEAYLGAIDFARILSLSILLLPYRLVNTVVLSAGDSKSFSNMAIFSAVITVSVAFIVNAVAGAETAIYVFALRGLIIMPLAWKLGRRNVDLTVASEARMLIALVAAVGLFTAGKSMGL
ncbi:MAG: oligosaccharide flippase family protein [Pseudomonadota bacterium]